MAAGLFVVSGPSGSGKTTVVEEALTLLQKKYPIKRVITYTTRPARTGEVDGEHYHFLSVDDFKNKIEQGFFLEWSAWYDHYYGSPASIVEDIGRGTSYLAILDRPGALNVKRAYPQTVLIWIEPPSLEELKRRLEGRGQNDKADIDNRLIKAVIEMDQEHTKQLFSYTIKNDDLSVAVLEFVALIEAKLA